MRKILVIAPHPDDETIGCGGTLLRHKDHGDEISCTIMTKLKTNLLRYVITQEKKEAWLVDQLALCYNLRVITNHDSLLANRKYITSKLPLSVYTDLTTHICLARNILYDNGYL